MGQIPDLPIGRGAFSGKSVALPLRGLHAFRLNGLVDVEPLEAASVAGDHAAVASEAGELDSAVAAWVVAFRGGLGWR